MESTDYMLNINDVLEQINGDCYIMTTKSEMEQRDAEMQELKERNHALLLRCGEYVNENIRLKRIVALKSAPAPSPVPRRIIKNGPAMVVFWQDGTKTIVKRKKGAIDDDYTAYSAALAKKIYGNNSYIKRMIKNVMEIEK